MLAKKMQVTLGEVILPDTFACTSVLLVDARHQSTVCVLHLRSLRKTAQTQVALAVGRAIHDDQVNGIAE